MRLRRVSVDDFISPKLSILDHNDYAIHLIGDTLAAPTVIQPLSVGASSLGTSPFAAREDHAHNLDTTVGTLGGQWVGYIPATAGITIGNGAVSGIYTLTGKTCSFLAIFTLGTTSTINGSIGIGLPFTANKTSWNFFNTVFWDNSASIYSVGGSSNETGTVSGFVLGVGGAYPTIGFVTALIPFTWAVSDQFIMSGTYPIA